MAAWLDGIFAAKKKKSLPEQTTAPTPIPTPPPYVKLPTPQVRTVFMGTPHLAAALLETLITEKYNIVGVITQPDKPAGRKKELKASAVKELALKHSLPLEQPRKMDAEAIGKIRDWKPDLIVVAAYGKILSEEVLKIPGLGALNVHASLLPRWRGASPIQNSLLAGDQETGVTLMVMDKGMDTGDIITQKTIPIAPDDTQETLSTKITEAGQSLLVETLPLWVKRKIPATPQSEEGITLCQLIEREDGHILFTEDAESIYNRYRALYPWPGIFAFWKKGDGVQRMKLTKISYQKQSPQIPKKLGEVFELGEHIGIQTSTGVIFLEEIQPEGKTAMSISDFVRGNQDFIGSLLQ